MTNEFYIPHVTKNACERYTVVFKSPWGSHYAVGNHLGFRTREEAETALANDYGLARSRVLDIQISIMRDEGASHDEIMAHIHKYNGGPAYVAPKEGIS